MYNLAGQEVAIITNRHYSNGEHVLQWDAQTIPTGTYFYKLSAGDFNATRKLVILR